jgi:hypothetical protein
MNWNGLGGQEKGQQGSQGGLFRLGRVKRRDGDGTARKEES